MYFAPFFDSLFYFSGFVEKFVRMYRNENQGCRNQITAAPLKNQIHSDNPAAKRSGYVILWKDILRYEYQSLRYRLHLQIKEH